MAEAVNRKPSKLKAFFKSNVFVTLIWVVGIVVLWEVIATIVESSFSQRQAITYFPHLYQIVALIFSDKIVGGQLTTAQLLFPAAGTTLLRALYGFIIGIVLGFALALAMNISGAVEKIAFPYLMIIQMIPILGMAPVILAITQDIGKARMVIAAILTFYPVATNVLAGFKAAEKEKHELMYSYSASKWQIYTKMLIPASIPYFFTGLKIAAPMAVTASVLVDTLQGDGGLGNVLSVAIGGKYATKLIFWDCVFLSAIVGVLSYTLMGWLQNLCTPQNRKHRKRREKND
ncbi:MAG: ABC transporter permease [Acutalibacteraceae bacterium]